MSRTPVQAYDELIRRIKAINLLRNCEGVLGWDQQTYMPPKASAYRADQARFAIRPDP